MLAPGGLLLAVRGPPATRSAWPLLQATRLFAHVEEGPAPRLVLSSSLPRSYNQVWLCNRLPSGRCSAPIAGSEGARVAVAKPGAAKVPAGVLACGCP